MVLCLQGKVIKLNNNANINSELKNILDFIEEIVGHNWIENWVHGMRDNFGRLPQNAPPLAVSWLKAKDELAAYELTDRLMISESTARLLQLGSDLKELKEYKDIQYPISLLKGDVEKYSDACHLMFIAANYHHRGIEFKFSQNSSQPDLTLLNCKEEIPVMSIAPVLESTSLLVNKVLSIIKNAITRLPMGEGILYIDFPLPPSFSPEQLVNEISKQAQITNLGENISLVVTISYIEKLQPTKLKHLVFLLKQNTSRNLLL